MFAWRASMARRVREVKGFPSFARLPADGLALVEAASVRLEA